MSRDKYGARREQRAFDYFDRGDVRNAVTLFVSDLNAPTGLRIVTPLGNASRFSADGKTMRSA